ncbi:MAG TPA: 30S ribosomal protein S1 [Microbacterium sp.]|nr:30S ribosomal protein S1 [Microbacterium sp.]
MGCGDGSFALKMARNYPDRNFLAIERLLGRVRKVCRRATRANLSNLGVLRLEARYTIEWLLPPSSVSRLHLLFPDPWPKARHHRRRLVQQEFLAAVEETLKGKDFNDGSLIEGTVVKIDRDEVLLDVGYKTEGVIPSRELSIKHDVDPNEVVNVGDQVEALVLQKEDKEGRLILSKKRAQYERAWGDVEKIKENDGVVTGSVIEVVKGGLIVDIGLRGFLPASLIELRRVRDLTPYLGQEIEAKILELDKNRNNVVLSRRALLEQTQSESRSNFLNNLHKGQVRKGTVSSIVNFGAFVDLGGVDGLVHVSELSWKHIEHASEVVEVGQEVTVEILEVDLDRERVSLSLKATQEDPWQVFARTHAIGQIAPGKVTKLVPFGAFVRVADGIEGLVHISELSGKHVELAEQVVSVGEEVFVKVIDIDLERRRISLSLKQANESIDPFGVEFDPALYGMVTEYDENGEYKYPEGFDPETNQWKEGFDEQREKWEQEYAAAQARWEAHKATVAKAAEAEAAKEADDSYSGSSASGSGSYSSESPVGTLADDEALAALREKLSGR